MNSVGSVVDMNEKRVCNVIDGGITHINQAKADHKLFQITYSC